MTGGAVKIMYDVTHVLIIHKATEILLCLVMINYNYGL